MPGLNSNLEPITEGDLDLEGKFKTGGLEESVPKDPMKEKKIESLDPVIEKSERKEGSVEKETAYSKILSKMVKPTVPSDDSVEDDAKNANAEMDADSKVTKLVNLAMEKGVVHAVKVARHMDDNYALDEFHDRMLADDLHNALLKKGLIKEI